MHGRIRFLQWENLPEDGHLVEHAVTWGNPLNIMSHL